MCRIVIDCEAACQRLEDAQQLDIVKFFDRAAVSDDARDFINKSCKSHSIFFNFKENHWLSRIWVKRNFPRAIASQQPANIDIAIGCCPVRLANIEAKAKVLICNDVPADLPENILLASDWKQVAAIVANYHK